MTRHLVIAGIALVLLLAVGLVQTALNRMPVVDSSLVAEGCDGLRLRYAQEHAAWKSGVRLGQDESVAGNLATMRAILHQLGEMDECRG